MSSSVRGVVDSAAIALGARVRHTRGLRGITLREMAFRLGVSPATMSAVENGRTGISPLRLTELARVLEVSADDLLTPLPQTGCPAEQSTTDDAALRDWRRYDRLAFDGPLGAALEAFLDVGYHGSTMRDIARRAGLSVPGIYHHHASKQEMLFSILHFTMADLTRRCELVLAESESAVDRFSLLVENLALFHTHRRDLGFIGVVEMRSLEEPDYSRIMLMRNKVQEMVTTEVERGRREGAFVVDEPREAARAVVTMCTGLAQWFSPGGSASAEEVARRYVGYGLRLVCCQRA
ncbi:TetR family transcriptional regulator [Mycobacterium sp. MS1601]|uniref:TetR family transcriptional regulator n=1 Tax=Mycobacterium sp. MS1601 TaxID=1936029 RepID=UPI00178C8B05|nr:TetR family transcriptional regulator [Mycobacterium sp. MS1601]